MLFRVSRNLTTQNRGTGKAQRLAGKGRYRRASSEGQKMFTVKQRVKHQNFRVLESPKKPRKPVGKSPHTNKEGGLSNSKVTQRTSRWSVGVVLLPLPHFIGANEWSTNSSDLNVMYYAVWGILHQKICANIM